MPDNLSPQHQPARDDDSVTRDLSSILGYWAKLSSDNTTSMHQFRIHSIFALIGLGSLIEIVSRYAGDSNVAPLMIMVSSILMLLLNSYYRRRETAWEITSFQIQEHATYIAMNGYENFSLNFGEIAHPDRVYYKNYRKRIGLFKFDFMTMLTLFAFVLINSTVGLKLANETYKFSIERRDVQTSTETSIPIPMKRPRL